MSLQISRTICDKEKYMEESHKSYTISSRRTFGYLILVIRREGRNVVHDAIFLHIAMVAEKVHFVYLLLILRFQLILLSSKPDLQLFLLGGKARL